MQKNVVLVLDLNQDRECVIFSENYRNCVFAPPSPKNKGLPRRYLFSPSMRVLRRPRVLCTFMRQQCAVSRPVPVTILIPDPPFPWVDTLSGVPHQPDRSVSHPDRPVDHPEPVFRQCEWYDVHSDVSCADPSVTPSQLQPLELSWLTGDHSDADHSEPQ